MAEGDHLWIGTGCGAVHIFSVHTSVSNPSARIRQLAKQGHGKSSDQDANSDSGGLLGQVVGDEQTDIEKSSQAPVGGDDTPELSRPARYYESRRKTRFGRTLHRERPSRSNLTSVYKLSVETSQQTVTAKNESVRIILPIRYGVVIISV